MKILKISWLLAVLFIAAVSVSADDKKNKSVADENLYVVSAKSGVVSLIDGDVSVKRGNAEAQPLLEGEDLKSGDVIHTGNAGRVEILLNPGTYLRLAENSEFAFPNLAPFKLKLNLVVGTAILEASVIDVAIQFNTPHQHFTLTREGLYRFNANRDGTSELMVRKGKVAVAGSEVKEGKKLVVSNGRQSLVAFDKKAEDDFDNWSKARARTLIAANKQLSNRRMKNSLTAGLFASAWVYDPFTRTYTFLPGWDGFSSPYGFRYSTCNPYWYYNPYGYSNGNGGGYWGGNPGGGHTSGGGNTSGGGGNTGGGRGTISDGVPYTKGGNPGGGSVDTGGTVGGRGTHKHPNNN
ncbi:MAG: FecR domain-containing protein [Acidobacteria bacterium]|nr:FecR domain-containing protein [Acidobacteriota bacterium]